MRPSLLRTLAFEIAALALAGAWASAPAAAQDVGGPPPATATTILPDPGPKVVDGVATLKLRGHRDWTETGLRVRRGDLVSVRAWGRIRVARAGNRMVDPLGVDVGTIARVYSDAPACSVIAVVGEDNNDYVKVGKSAEFRAPHDGTLYLAINQLDTAGNTGDFDVRVSVGQAVGLTFGRPEAPVIVAPPAVTPAADGAKTVVVSPRLDWTNTYVTLKRGDTVVVEASGAVVLDLAGHSAGPEGIGLKDPGKLIVDKPTGALIAVVGVDNNDFIFVGANGHFTAQRSGLLFLGINEENLANNSGSFTAKVRVVSAPAKP
jgi:hypothetical protein